MKSDFADWLSPMLVKELRQGMRSRVFISLFILLQALMVLNIAIGLLSAADNQDTDASTGFFWALVSLSILLAVPMMGLNSVIGEIKANTLELIFLTRLTAMRIIVGKWLAIFVQALLLVSAVLPYLVLRYFMGGVNLTNELLALLLLLAGSALLCAVATGLSPYLSRLTRSLLVVGVIVFFFSFARYVVGPFAGSFVLGGRGLFVGWGSVSLALCAVIFLLLMLEAAASKIAPPAENHSARKRALALAAFVLALVSSWLLPDSREITMITFIIASAVCAAALCEQPRWLPILFRPFAARGLPGRAVGRLFYPGWFTGVLFMATIFGGFAALMTHQRMLVSSKSLLMLVAFAGTLLLPVALIRGFFPKTNKAVAFFFGFQVICVFVTVFCQICDHTLRTSFNEAIAVIPLSSMILGGGKTESDTNVYLVEVATTTLASLGVLLVLIYRPLKQTRSLEMESLQLSDPDAPLA